jgi:uncharacterized metal-binding protein
VSFCGYKLIKKNMVGKMEINNLSKEEKAIENESDNLRPVSGQRIKKIDNILETAGKNKISPNCAACDISLAERICYKDNGKGYKGCPSLTKKDLLAETNKAYETSDIKDFAYKASVQEAECYANRDQKPYIMQPCKTRIVEICEFAQKMGYKRLGLAFCIGLSKEAKVVEEIFRAYGFDIVSVCCKAGNTSKEIIGISNQEQVFRGKKEAMCNPVFQASVLDEEKADFNVLLGLCVGHDTLFFQTTKTPTTVLAVKDRVTGHNPLVPVYQADSYYRRIRKPL